MNNLRSKLIRLAYRNPHLRSDLLPLLKTAGKADGLFKNLPRELKQHFFRQSNDVTLKNVKNFVMTQLEMFAEEYEEINDVMADFEKLSPKELLEGLQNIS